MTHTKEQEVKRYDMVGEYDFAMGETVDGDYVTYTDYAALKAENERLDLEAAGAACWTAEVEQRLEDAKKELAALRAQLSQQSWGYVNECPTPPASRGWYE